MGKELVSTIIPVFNRTELLREAVHSVLCQTYRPVEIIIVDDGSDDETRDVIDDIKMQEPDCIASLHISNSGPGVARERGRVAAQGRYIQYLDSDDLLLPDKFTSQVSGLNDNAHCAISYCQTRYRDAAGNVLSNAWKRTGEQVESLFPSMLLGRWWGTSTPLYRRSAVDDAGPWSTLTCEEDWEYDCRFAAKGVKLHYVAETLSEERGHDVHRLSAGGGREPDKMSSRAKAREMILTHALAAGISGSSPEMQHFSRSLFLLSRQCGALGLVGPSRRLFTLSREAADAHGHFDLEYFAYAAGARVLGWRLMGQMSHFADRVRNFY
jgi:hypothetical protein